MLNTMWFEFFFSCAQQCVQVYFINRYFCYCPVLRQKDGERVDQNQSGDATIIGQTK